MLSEERAQGILRANNSIFRGKYTYFGIGETAFIREKNHCFRITSLQLLAGIQQNFMGTFNTKGRCTYHRLVPVRPFNSRILSPLISYAVCI
jgi:hypothetical protein